MCMISLKTGDDMELKEIIQYYRKKHGWSLETIGDYVGVSKSTIKRWEDGESKHIPETKLEKLSELFGINVSACIHGTIKPILGYVKAGYDLYAEENLLGYEEVSKCDAKLGDYYLKVQGDSMSGSRIYDGDLVYVKSCQDVKSGDLAVVLIDGQEVTIKKVIKKKDTVILMASNPAYEPRIFIKEEIRRLTILGKILHVKVYF